MKTVSVSIPTYNEEENIIPLAKTIVGIFENELIEYNYEIVFIDNCSTDNTKTLILLLCAENPKIKAIFNARNFGQFNSAFYGLCQTTGDCAIFMCADFQEPPEMIPQFIKEWEAGYSLVLGIKTSSKEKKFMYFLRSLYYKMVKKFSEVEQIEHFTSFGLYDKSFLDIMRQLDDPTPFLRGIVAELGFNRKDIPYEQQLRRAGKTKNNWAILYDAAMRSFTSYTKVGPRIATIFGFILSILSFISAFVYLILKLIFWDWFPAGMIPVLLGVFVLGSIQLFFIGLLGEYIINIGSKVIKRPLVVEEKRINFD